MVNQDVNININVSKSNEIDELSKKLKKLRDEKESLANLPSITESDIQKKGLLSAQIKEVTDKIREQEKAQKQSSKTTTQTMEEQLGLTGRMTRADKTRVSALESVMRRYRWFQSLILVTLNFLRVISGVSPVLGSIMSMLGTGLGFILNMILIPLIPLFVWLMKGLIWIGMKIKELNEKHPIKDGFGLGSLIGLIALALPGLWALVQAMGLTAWSAGQLGLSVGGVIGVMKLLGGVGGLVLAGLALGFVLWKLGVLDALHKINYAIWRFLWDIPRMVGEVFDHVKTVGIVQGVADILLLLFSYAVEWSYLGMAWGLELIAGFLDFLQEIPTVVSKIWDLLWDNRYWFQELGIEWGKAILRGIVDVIPYIGTQLSGVLGLDQQRRAPEWGAGLRDISQYYRDEAARVAGYRSTNMPLGGLFPQYTEQERYGHYTHPDHMFQPIDTTINFYVEGIFNYDEFMREVEPEFVRIMEEHNTRTGIGSGTY